MVPGTALVAPARRRQSESTLTSYGKPFQPTRNGREEALLRRPWLLGEPAEGAAIAPLETPARLRHSGVHGGRRSALRCAGRGRRHDRPGAGVRAGRRARPGPADRAAGAADHHSAAVRWPGDRDRSRLAPSARRHRRLASPGRRGPADPGHRGRRAALAAHGALRPSRGRRRAARPHRREPGDPTARCCAAWRSWPAGRSRSPHPTSRRGSSAGRRRSKCRLASGGRVRAGLLAAADGRASPLARHRRHRRDALELRADRDRRHHRATASRITGALSSGSSPPARSRCCPCSASARRSSGRRTIGSRAS